MTRTLTGRAALAAALLVLPLLTACSGGSGGAGGTNPPASGAATSGVAAGAAVRWWSNSAVRSGSTIDPADPGAAAGRLHPSTADYCGMLRETVAAGHSIAPSSTAADPAQLVSTEAFLAEVQRVAPQSLDGAWHTLAGAVTALVSSGGDLSKVKGIDAKAVAQAETAIAADAHAGCGLDLSASG